MDATKNRLYFCSVSNSVSQDEFLSLKAKGLYLLIQSCLEDPEFDYNHFKPAIQAKCKEGSDAFDSAWKELKKAGYLKQQRISQGDSENKGFHYEYKLLTTRDGSTAIEILQAKNIFSKHPVSRRITE